MKAPTRPSPETVAWLRQQANRRLSPEEWRAGLAVPLGEAEREETISLIDWFCKRYPTPAERMAYVRRAYRRWTAAAAMGEDGRDRH